jgi:hypothetical protein
MKCALTVLVCSIAVFYVVLGQPTVLEPISRPADAVNREILLVPVSSMVKIMPEAPISMGTTGEPLRISLARGEVEAGQIIIAAPGRRLQSVTHSISKLKDSRGRILPRSAVELAVMGYVQTEPGVKLAYEVSQSGWFPDPILPFIDRFDVEQGRVQSLWLSIRAPVGQAPGTYRGHVTVSATNVISQTLPVVVQVYDFTIPRKRSLPTYITTFTEYLHRIHGNDWNDTMYWKYVDFLHAHRLNFDNPYREHEPPPTVRQIKRLVAGGQDAWGLRFIRQAGKGFSDVGVESPQYKDYLSQAIADAKAARSVLKDAAAGHLAYIYMFDEVRQEHWPLLRETAQELRKELPGVPIITSAFDREYGATSGLDQVIDVWVGIIAHFDTQPDRAKADRARSKGKKVAWYTTVWPPRPYPNFFIEYDAIEPRLLMGAMTQKYKPDAFGYWALNWWFQAKDQQPISEGPYTKWKPFFQGTHGEGSWIYAGKHGPISSIRFENFRDGLEDYEYYKLLEKAVLQARSRGIPEKDLTRARELLAIPDEIVRDLKNFTRSPDILSRHRHDVATMIEYLGRINRRTGSR